VTTVRRLRRKYAATGSVRDLHRAPKRRVTTPVQDVFIRLNHLRDRKRTAVRTSREVVGTHGRRISNHTVLRRLREAGIKCRRPCKGLILTARHRQERLRWARRHVRWTRADWANVLFTDESRFRLRQNDGTCLI